MKTWSRTHDFESYLYWWAITGASVIRGAGEEENKAIKGERRRRRVTNLILTKLKGYSTQNSKIMTPISPILRQSCRADPPRTLQSNDAPEEVSTKAPGVMMTKTVLYFIISKALKKGKSSLDQNHGAFSPTPCNRGVLAWQTVAGAWCWWSGREPQ